MIDAARITENRFPGTCPKPAQADSMNIAAHTLEILCDPQRKESLLGKSGDAAQATVDLLQGVRALSDDRIYAHIDW